MKIEYFVGVTSENKQVKVVKRTEPIPGHPGKDKIPIFELSTGEHLNPLDRDLVIFRIGDSEIKVAILYDQPKGKV